jgi:hypothetical protein
MNNETNHRAASWRAVNIVPNMPMMSILGIPIIGVMYINPVMIAVPTSPAMMASITSTLVVSFRSIEEPFR